MKKLFVSFCLVVAFSVTGLSAAQACDNASWRCYDAGGAQLGDVSVTCSIQQPLLNELPRCLPNFDLFQPFNSVMLCRTKYPNAKQACPLQSWPGAWAFSKCQTMSF